MLRGLGGRGREQEAQARQLDKVGQRPRHFRRTHVCTIKRLSLLNVEVALHQETEENTCELHSELEPVAAGRTMWSRMADMA